MSNSWLDGIIEIEDFKMRNRITELLNDKDVVWEGLGPDGINSIANSQSVEYERLEKEYRERIVEAFKAEDYLTVGKLFHFLLSSYVLSVAIAKDPFLDIADFQIERP